MMRAVRSGGGLALVSMATVALAVVAVADPPSVEVVEPGVAPAPNPTVAMLNEIDRLREEVDAHREALAKAQLEASAAQRELDELRQFVADHHEFGNDFAQYEMVKAAAEQEARRRAAEANRARREEERAERRARMQEARAQRDQERATAQRLAYYNDRGFGPLGLEVFISRIGYAYPTVDATASRIDYVPGFGNYLRLYPGARVDFSTMTISGSVLNASSATRNVGVAITFFDEEGNQVGSETVQVDNARPDVPYPFTSSVTMALDRPFASSSQYVLYADPIEP